MSDTEPVNGPEETQGFLDAVLERFSALGGVELELPDRHSGNRPVDL